MNTAKLEDLQEFPCDYIFKAFGPNDEEGHFSKAVHSAVSSVVDVSLDAVKTRASSKGNYLSVSVVARLQNVQQVKDIYSALRKIPDLKYLL